MGMSDRQTVLPGSEWNLTCVCVDILCLLWATACEIKCRCGPRRTGSALTCVSFPPLQLVISARLGVTRAHKREECVDSATAL